MNSTPDEGPPRFATGGYVSGPGPRLGGCVITVHPDECLIRAEDARAGRLVCGRPEHPTATSDCGPNAGQQQARREHAALKQAFRALAYRYGGTLPSQFSEPEDVVGCEAMHVAARVLGRPHTPRRQRMTTTIERAAAAMKRAMTATPEESERLRQTAEDLAATRPDCDHHWSFNIKGGEPLSVGICTLCGQPNWDDLRRQMSELDGATERGPFDSYPSTPGEFAARWNSWTDEQRSEWLRGDLDNAEVVDLCRVVHQRSQERPLKPLARDAEGNH